MELHVAFTRRIEVVERSEVVHLEAANLEIMIRFSDFKSEACWPCFENQRSTRLTEQRTSTRHEIVHLPRVCYI